MNCKYELTFTARAPITHAAFSDGSDTGNASMFRREPIVSLTGYPRVPVVSGNAIRGILRRIIMRELFGYITLDDFAERFGVRATLDDAPIQLNDTAKRAWDRLYAALCIGGTIEQAENGISPDMVRQLRAEFPALSVLGSALYTQLIPGMVHIGFAWPICTETIDAGICRSVENMPVVSAEDLLTEVGLVRHIDRENADPENSGVKPMPYTIEALATGTRLQSEITFDRQATDIEIAVIMHGVKQLQTIGGKAAAGFGTVDTEICPVADDMLYLDWLSNTDIKDLLLRLAEKVV